jgi:DNA-binding MarR family transcriptional regulator
MERDNTPLYLQFYNAMMQFKRQTRHLPPPHQGMSHMEFVCLHLIDDYTRENVGIPGMKMALLSQSMNLSKPTVSHLVNGLEEKELVMRLPSKQDRRVTYLCLTEKSRTLLQTGQEEMLRRLRQICDSLGHEDTETLIALINRLTDVFVTVLSDDSAATSSERSLHP